MSTLVLKPEALYAAYLRGRLDVPHTFDIVTDEPTRADIERAVAHDLGRTDRRDMSVLQPAPMADVVRRVREALGEPGRITEEQATDAALEALAATGLYTVDAPPALVQKVAAGIFRAVNGPAPAEAA